MELARFRRKTDVTSSELPSVDDIPGASALPDDFSGSLLTLGALGVSPKEIAALVNLPESEIEKLAGLIEAAAALANARVANTAFQLAVSGASPKSTFSWLKARAGWKEDGVNINNNLMIAWPLPPSPREKPPVSEQ